MDKTQLSMMWHLMLGDRAIGVAGGGGDALPVEVPENPRLQVFILARMGDRYPGSDLNYSDYYKPERRAFAAFIREFADGIDPDMEGPK